MRNYVWVIIIILILLVAYIIFRNNNNKNKNKKDTINHLYKYTELRDKLKTGDVLLFSCKKHDNLFGRLQYYIRTNLLGSEFGHVGIVIRDNDQIYLVECTDVCHTADNYAYRFNSYGKGGVRIIELDYLLDRYHKKYGGIFGVRFISKAIPNNTIFRKIIKHKNKIFENKIKLFLVAFIDNCLWHSLASNLSDIFYDQNRIICSQFAHELLYNCDVVGPYNSNLFWPHLFDDNQIFDYIQKISYTPIHKFTFDL